MAKESMSERPTPLDEEVIRFVRRVVARGHEGGQILGYNINGGPDQFGHISVTFLADRQFLQFGAAKEESGGHNV